MATPQQIIQGMQWYNEAHTLAVKLAAQHGVTVIQAAQVISILSPQKKWDMNKREAVAIFNEHFKGIQYGYGYYATVRTLREVHAIMEGDYLIPIKRTKTYSFADNIAYLEESTEITVDRHALRVCYDDTSARINKVGINDYKYAREAYQLVADSLGIKGYQLQAITWVTYKQFVNR
tara:strand:+ start:1821 stop:2351 length:531 start_codon:yes stop_codon:yes gene_type:complete